MRARIITAILALSLSVPTLGSQHAAKIPRVGFLSPAPERGSPTFAAFRQGLADLGYVDGKSVEIVARYAEGQYDRFPALLDDLVRAKPDVLAIQGAVTLRAAKKVVKEIPMVFAMVVDPVKLELVPSLERPGENITGITTFDPQQPRKQLELLKRSIPGLQRVAILGDAGAPDGMITACEEQASAVGLQAIRFLLKTPNPDLEGIFANLLKERAEALLVLEEPVMGLYVEEIFRLAARHRIPTLYSPLRPEAGELLAYGTSFSAGMRRMAFYVDKILRGAKAGDFPVETLTRYELIVNLKTAREIGVTIPSDVLKQADRVIQ